ncbi:MAG TPA: SpoIIE family protein phosphatase, partial [Bacteroidia bacterium]
IALVYSEMPDTAFERLGIDISERFKRSLDYFLKSVKIAEEMDDQERIAIQYGNIGNLYMAKAKKETGAIARQQLYKQAEDYFSRSVKISGEIGDLYGIMEVNQNLSDLYYALGQEGIGKPENNYLNAYEHFKLYSKAKDSIFNEEKNKEITRHELTYEFEKKEASAKAEQEKKDAVARAESHKQRIVIALVACVLLLVLVSAAFIFRSLQVTRKQKSIIEKQKEVVDRKNLLITDSITYALTIQESILPPEEHFYSAFSESFILFLPKDIVSGDFYWIRHLQDEVLLAAVDCTGHGVPGAFMSLHGYNHLENIVNEKKIRAPHHILDELNKAVVQTLNHDDSDVVKHGMDMSLVKFAPGKNELQFSGAKNGIYVSSGTEFMELKADRVSVGNKFGKNFNVQSVTLKKGDMIYLFSDGFMDQKGGPQGRRLQVSPFKELLKKNAHLSCAQQKKEVHDAFISWKGTYEQVDDVMVIGVRV